MQHLSLFTGSSLCPMCSGPFALACSAGFPVFLLCPLSLLDDFLQGKSGTFRRCETLISSFSIIDAIVQDVYTQSVYRYVCITHHPLSLPMLKLCWYWIYACVDVVSLSFTTTSLSLSPSLHSLSLSSPSSSYFGLVPDSLSLLALLNVTRVAEGNAEANQSAKVAIWRAVLLVRVAAGMDGSARATCGLCTFDALVACRSSPMASSPIVPYYYY